MRTEDQAQLRWVAGYRGDEGALLAPVTDDAGRLVKLLVTHVTADGCKSPYGSGRSTIAARGGRAFVASERRARTWSRRKGRRRGWRRARQALNMSWSSAAHPIWGKSRFRRRRNPSSSRETPIPQARPPIRLCGVVRYCVLGKDFKVGVTARPNDIAPKDAPPLKDLDDVWRYDPVYVGLLLQGANLEHGRLGEAVENAILEAALQLDVVALGAQKAHRQLARN